MRLGQAIELSLDAYPGERFRGEIIALNPRLDEVGRSQALRAQVANADQRLKPGQFVKVSVILAERPQALLIPEEAVMPLGQLLFVNLVQGVIARVSPQMNIFAIGFPITISVGLVGVVLTLPMMQAPFTMALERMLAVGRRDRG